MHLKIDIYIYHLHRYFEMLFKKHTSKCCVCKKTRICILSKPKSMNLDLYSKSMNLDVYHNDAEPELPIM